MSDQSGAITNIMLVIVGTMVVSIHVVFSFRYKHVFVMLTIIYVIAFCTIALIFVKKKVMCITSTENDVAFYGIWFVIGMQCILALQLGYNIIQERKRY